MDFTYEIVEALGVICERKDKKGNKWTKEVNLVSWNGREPKIDIREWNEDHSIMTKGLTFSEEEAEGICMILYNFMRERSK